MFKIVGKMTHRLSCHDTVTRGLILSDKIQSFATTSMDLIVLCPLQGSYNHALNPFTDLKGYYSPHQKLTCFVLYLKISNTFLKSYICIL